MIKHVVIIKDETSHKNIDCFNIIIKEIPNIIHVYPVEIMEKYIFEPKFYEDEINKLIDNLNKCPEKVKDQIIVFLKNINNIDEMINNQLPDEDEKELLIKLGTSIKDNCMIICENSFTK